MPPATRSTVSRPRARRAAGNRSSRAERPARRLAEVVAERIEQEIVARGWPVGEILGSETELIERFDVSRAVFREAVRIVEHHNVARMRRGPGGGLVIAEPDPGPVENAMALYLRYNGVGRGEILDALAALQLSAVAKAAETITEDGIARLRATLAREQEADADGPAPDLHVVIAELTGNTALRLFVEVLTQLDEGMSAAEDGAVAPEDPGALERAAAHHAAHVAIVEAIAAGDAALAQHRMRRHLEADREHPQH